MEFTQFMNYFVYTAIGVGGWFMRQLWDAVQNLRKDLSILREELARDYMPRDETKHLFETILEAVKETTHELRSHEQREMLWTKQILAELGHKVNK